MRIATFAAVLDRHAPKSGGVTLVVLAILIAAASVADVLLKPPFTVVADVLSVIFFFVAGWYFGVLGALAAWGAAVVVPEAMRVLFGAPPAVSLSNGARGFFVALLFGLVFQMRRALGVKKAELAESETRFRRLAEASFEGLALVQDGAVVEANDALAGMLRIPRDTLVGKQAAGFLALDDAQRTKLFAMQASDSPPTAEIKVLRGDGTTFDAEIISRVMSRGGAPVRVVGVRDVTQRKQTEEAIRRNEQLSALGTLVAGVAHEINNPLTYIKGNVELIQLEAQDIAAAAPSVRAEAEALVAKAGVALEGLERIGDITKSLRRIARSPDRVRSPEDMNQLVRNVVQVASGRVPPGVAVDLDLRARQEAVVNGSEIAQVVLNLLFNAADAVRAQGGHITIRSFDADDRVVIEVADDGVGIPEEEQAHLFTPFFTTKAHGTGLGLSVSRSIVKDHGGDLTFVSTRGMGTTFRLSLRSVPRA